MNAKESAMSQEVAAVFASFPDPAAQHLLKIRSLIFDVASQSTEIGVITESLRWGQPAYLTTETGSGSTVRLGYKQSDDTVRLFFHCQTTLVGEFRQRYKKHFRFEGNRAIIMDMADNKLPEAELSDCIQRALRYHLDKPKR